MKKRTINDLDPNKNLGGVKFKHPKTGETCIWVSQWGKGIFYKKKPKDTQVFTIFVEDLTEALKFETVE